MTPDEQFEAWASRSIRACCTGLGYTETLTIHHCEQTTAAVAKALSYLHTSGAMTKEQLLIAGVPWTFVQRLPKTTPA